MKFLLVMSLALSGLSAFAGGDKQKQEEKMKQEEQGMSFAQKKEHRLNKLDKKVSALSAYRSCVEGAQNESSLKSCKINKEDAQIEAQEEPKSESESQIQKEESSSGSTESTESSSY